MQKTKRTTYMYVHRCTSRYIRHAIHIRLAVEATGLIGNHCTPHFNGTVVSYMQYWNTGIYM